MSSKNTLSKTLFYSQLSISIIGLVFSAIMSVIDKESSAVYVTIFSSLLFAWIPSPIVPTPAAVPHVTTSDLDKLRADITSLQQAQCLAHPLSMV